MEQRHWRRIFKVLSLVLVTSLRGGGSLPLQEEECPDHRAGDYFNLLSPDELKLLCHMKHRIEIGGEEPDLPNPNVHSPTDVELRELIHVDTLEDEQKKAEQLREADLQEHLLRQREKDNLRAQQILSQILYGRTQQQQEELGFAPQEEGMGDMAAARFDDEQDIMLDYRF